MPISRRAFLAGAGAAVVAACSGGDDADSPSTTTTTAADTTTATTGTTLAPVDLPGPPFTLGVASGDPLPDRVVIWTRLAPDPTNGGGMPQVPVGVQWEVASDEAFTDVVRSGIVAAEPDLVHAVHVDVDGLEPGTAYHYRFRVNDEVSPVGRTRTLAAADAPLDELRFAVANCQHYDLGYYAAYREMAAADDIDFVLFLGDYIYEYSAGGDPRASSPANEVFTLDDYRTRYASYRTDADLQAAHAAFPWIVMWDDHEVVNNYEGDVDERGTPPAEVHARRAAAYRAWYEHMPVRIDRPVDADVRLYHDVAFGDLATMFVLDVRQYGDPPACRGEPGVGGDTGACAALTADTDGQFLGQEQEDWLTEGLAATTRRWTILGNPVMLAGLNIGTPAAPGYFLESWDGYPGARQRLLDALQETGAPNPVVVTGDYHAVFVSDVHATVFDQASPVLATEFLSPAISSALFPTDYTAQNPQVHHFVPRHGYLRCTVEPDSFTATFRLVSDVRDPNATVSDDSTWVVRAGSPVAERTA